MKDRRRPVRPPFFIYVDYNYLSLNMLRFKFWLLLFLPFTVSAQSFAPSPDWRFDNFNSQNHFISREISSLTVDRFGYVWACSRGVQRFDGYQTVDFNSFEPGNKAIKDNYTDV